MGTRFRSSNPEHQIYEDDVCLHAEAAEVLSAIDTVTGEIPGDCRSVLVYAHVEPTLAVGDTFDLYVQTRVGTLWVDVVHFTQILGNGLDVDLFDKVAASLAEANFDVATALAADGARNIIGDLWRCRWIIAGATPSFVFSVSIHPM